MVPGLLVTSTATPRFLSIIYLPCYVSKFTPVTITMYGFYKPMAEVRLSWYGLTDLLFGR